jgi:hypothetical protein
MTHFGKASKRFTYVLVAVLAAGCSGSGITPRTGSTTAQGASQITVTANIAKSGLAFFRHDGTAAAAAKRKRLSVGGFKSLVFTGTLYPGYAGALPITVNSTINATSLPSTVTLGFNNVPTGNNEWVIINVVGYDSPGAGGTYSTLGQLGGLLSVGSSPGYITVDGGSTLRLQLALFGMADGLISTYDLVNETSLDSDLGGFIGASGTPTDPGTGLFTYDNITRLLDNLAAIYNRTITVQGSIATPSTVWVTWDWTNVNERNFSSNVLSTLYEFDPYNGTKLSFPIVVGAPVSVYDEGSEVAPHTPASGANATAAYVYALGFDASNGSTTINQVYGGSLRVGVSSQSSATASGPPWYGGYASVVERGKNNSSTVNVNVSNSTDTMTIDDPELSYLGAQDYGAELDPNGTYLGPTNPVFYASCETSRCFGAYSENQGVNTHLVPHNDGTSTLSFDQFNPWGVPTNAMEYCQLGSNECLPLSTNGTITTHEPWFSDVEDGNYWNAAPSSGDVSAVTVTGGQYKVTYSGGLSGYIAFSLPSNSPQYFYNGQELEFFTTMPTGSTVYLDANCGTAAYQTTSPVAGPYGTTVLFRLNSVPGLVTCQSTVLGFTLAPGSPSSGSFTIGSIMPY